jgi:NitT/TauT family transport system substrate-binding protein
VRTRRIAGAVIAVVASTYLAGCGTDSGTGSQGSSGKSLTTITFATAASAPTPLFENIYIADKLGYYKAAGLQVKFVNTGGNAAVTSQLSQGRAQVAVGVPNFQVITASKGDQLPGVNYYEYTYPSKWYLVVPPKSDISSVSDLKGKTLGITSRGTADEQVITALLKQHGVDPSSVHFQAVGETTAGGLALNNRQLDASLIWDTTRGLYDVNDIGYKVILGPKDIEKVGGFYVQATPQWLKAHRDLAVGFAQAVAKASVFALANPEAAASLYLDMYPSAASGKSKQQQVDDIVKTVKYRAQRWVPYQDPSKMGYIQPQEWQNEVEFAGVTDKVSDPSQFYTNDLIDQINKFDKSKVQQQAKDFKSGN